MQNLNRIPPVKTAVHQRVTPLLVEQQRVRNEMQALSVDPLLPLRAAVPLLGNPSYALLRVWIAKGQLRCWRAGHGHFRVRLSEIQRFLAENAVQP